MTAQNRPSTEAGAADTARMLEQVTCWGKVCAETTAGGGGGEAHVDGTLAAGDGHDRPSPPHCAQCVLRAPTQAASFPSSQKATRPFQVPFLPQGRGCISRPLPTRGVPILLAGQPKSQLTSGDLAFASKTGAHLLPVERRPSGPPSRIQDGARRQPCVKWDTADLALHLSRGPGPAQHLAS